jgi:hypothetical protein
LEVARFGGLSGEGAATRMSRITNRRWALVIAYGVPPDGSEHEIALAARPGERIQAWYRDRTGETYRPLTGTARRRLVQRAA